MKDLSPQYVSSLRVQSWAGYLGLTIDTTSRQFARLRLDGVLEFASGARNCTTCYLGGLREIAQLVDWP